MNKDIGKFSYDSMQPILMSVDEQFTESRQLDGFTYGSVHYNQSMLYSNYNDVLHTMVLQEQSGVNPM